METIKQQLANSQDALYRSFEQHGTPDDFLTQYSDVVDGVLAQMFTDGLQGNRQGVALLAVGGYGRRELFPYSDIDILFIYEDQQHEAAAKTMESVLYGLWNAGFKVGQAHRTIEECLTLATEDITIRTNLLDARLVAGDPALFSALHDGFNTRLLQWDVLEFVEAKLFERDQRHRRFGDSRYMLEPNVKEGKGGLRDLHSLWWLARYVYPIVEMHDLVTLGILTPEEYATFDHARQFLCKVRIHLHRQAERAEERLTFDAQQGLAISMGYGRAGMPEHRSIERFMRRYFAAVRTVGQLTRIFCAILEEEKKRKPRTPLAQRLQTPWSHPDFRLEGERVHVSDDQLFSRQPVRMLELFHIAQEHQLDIHPRALRLIAQHLHLIDRNMQQNTEACQVFLQILLSGKGSETALRRMSEAGVLGRFIPDFGRVIGQTQFNRYHVYTVDEHTLVALGILHNIERGKLNETFPLASDIVHRVQMKRTLYLALFCHDIAKGRSGDHSELGEMIAMKLAKRFGFSVLEAETAAWLVKYHLLFSHTAFKRDIHDPKTIQDFVGIVQSPERLRLLLILTAADISAVGAHVWNAWKGVLLRELYARAEELMGSGHVALIGQQAKAFRAQLVTLLPEWEPSEIEAYLEQGNPTFWVNSEPQRHAAMARMLKEAVRMTRPLVIQTYHDHGHSITDIMICTLDQNGLFSKLSGALSLSGANIVNAKIFTLKNGMAIDLFQVQDHAGDVFERPDRLAKMAVSIEQVVSGELDLAVAFASRRTGSALSAQYLPVPAQVLIENNASNIHTVIEVTGRDRTGFLYDVTHTINKLGLSIASAHVSTYGAQVADVFYVKDIFGLKVTHDRKITQIKESLLLAIEGGGNA